MSKMTDWFPPHIKPVREGVYEIKFTAVRSYQPMYATWNGLKWSRASHYASGGWHEKFRGADQDKYWRGFTEKQT